MAARSVAVALLFILLPLAGCIGPKDDVTPASTKDKPLVANATCADGCTKIVALQETNKTEAGAGGVNHQHDYWLGRERVTIFNAPALMSPMGATNAQNYQASTAINPPQGTFVWEGTGSVEVTISDPQRHACARDAGTLNGYPICTDTIGNLTAAPNVPAQSDPTSLSSGLKLRYKHAAVVEWLDAGELVWGKPTTIKITDPKQTDMPHATSSAWVFQIVSPNQYDSTLEFKVKADIIRAPGEIPLWPGHPNFYADSDSRRILDADAIACDGSTCSLPGYEKAGPIKAQKLVSYGTRSVYVWINITDVFDPNPALAVDNWFLWHYNSTGRDNVTNVFDKTNHSADKKEHHWVIPVDDNGMDSPYADGSRWTFQLGGAFYKAGVSCYGGCADWGAKYHIVAIATNRTLDLKDYDMSCLRDDYCPTPNATAQQDSPAPMMIHEEVGPLTVDGASDVAWQRPQ